MINFFRRDLKKVLRGTKKIKVEGVLFEIRKISPLDYFAGNDVLRNAFDVMKTRDIKETDISTKKIKKHFREVFLASVVKPQLISKPDESSDAVCVDEILDNNAMTEGLYSQIVDHTYGKKKLRKLSSLQGRA